MFRGAAGTVIATLLLLGASQAALAEKRVALVIGNASYSLAPLENPRNDADDVAAALKRLQFDVTERKDLRDFNQTVHAFEAAARDADVAFFFFSGHGVQIDKRGYLAPVDLKAESTSSALRELVAVQEVVSRIENAAKVSVIVLDACRDGPLQERLRRIAAERDKAAAPPKGLPPVSVAGGNTLLVYATGPGKTDGDGLGQRNSPFTESLLRNIEKPGLEIDAIFKRVAAEVLLATRGKQNPERLSRLQNELVLSPASVDAKAQPLGELAKLKEQLARLEALAASENRPGELAALKRRLGRLEADMQRKPQAEAAKSVKEALAAPVAENCLAVSGATGAEKPCIRPGSGESFKDCPDCPEMVIAPSGGFTMGSPKDEPTHDYDEAPRRRVSIAKPFAVGRFPVTRGEWARFVDSTGYKTDGGCRTWTGGAWEENQSASWRSPGFVQDDTHPAVCLNWEDANAYAGWLSKRTGKSYRLLSEAEYEYVARAGTTAPFWWGASIAPDEANYDGNNMYAGGGSKGEYRAKTVPVKSFKPNPWGLYQVHGNAWSWVKDCWRDTYEGAPADGSAWTGGDCRNRILRGGSWINTPRNLRSANRFWSLSGHRNNDIGFRLAKTLSP
jgi:formylglycine-generating enzyme required for sulfatase activity/uncharacterized caspase-like protein